jgi:hypothetical protein
VFRKEERNEEIKEIDTPQLQTDESVIVSQQERQH